MRVRGILVLLAAALLAACSFAGLPHDAEAVFPDPEAYVVSDRVAGFAAARDADSFYDALHPDAHTSPAGRASLDAVFEFLPAGEPVEVQRFYAQLLQGADAHQRVPIYLSVYDVEAGGKFAQMTIAVHPVDGVCCVVSQLDITPAARRPSTFNDFTLEGKSWLHYLIFSLLIFVPVFMIAVAILCFVEKRVRPRWAWIPFILIGLWGVTFNWTTGDIQTELVTIGPQGVYFKIISLHLLGAGFVTAGPFQPWIVTIGSPIGAIVYLVRRRIRKPAGGEKAPYEVAAP